MLRAQTHASLPLFTVVLLVSGAFVVPVSEEATGHSISGAIAATAGFIDRSLITPLATSIGGVVASAVTLSHPAQAQSSLCGQTITSSVTLSSDVQCSAQGITLGANAITLDCAQHQVVGSGGGRGITVQAYTGDTVENCKVSNFQIGIYVTSSGSGSQGTTITGNAANGNTFAGFYCTAGNGNSWAGNTASGDQWGFYFTSCQSYGAPGNTITSNTATSNSNGGFYLGSSYSNALSGNTANSNTGYGFQDDSMGSGTGGTGNTYSSNICNGNTQGGSSPAGLCSQLASTVQVSITLNQYTQGTAISSSNYFQVSYTKGGTAQTAKQTGGTLTIQADPSTTVTISGESSSSSSPDIWCLYQNGSPCSSVSFNSGSGVSETYYYHNEYFVSFEYTISGGGSPTPPSVGYFYYGTAVSVTLSNGVLSRWADAGSTATYTNPLSSSSGSEKWEASTASFTISSYNTPINPIYYNQYAQTVSYSQQCATGATCSPPPISYLQFGSSPSSALSTSSQLYWMDAGSTASVPSAIMDSLGNAYRTSPSSWQISGADVIPSAITYVLQTSTLKAGTLSSSAGSAIDVDEATTLSTSGASGGSGGYSYAWINLPAGCSTSNSASISCTPDGASNGPLTVTLTVTDSKGDSAPATLTLTVYPDPTVSVTPTVPLSYNQGQTASALSAAVTYSGPNTASVEWYSSASSVCSSSSTDTTVTGASFAPSTATAGTTYYCAVVSDSGVPGYRSASNVAKVTVTAPFQFSVSTTGNSFNVFQGESVNVPVNLILVSGTPVAVSMSVAWIPTGSNQWFVTQFAPGGSVVPPQALSLTIAASSSAPIGQYTAQIFAVGSGQAPSAEITVNVQAPQIAASGPLGVPAGFETDMLTFKGLGWSQGSSVSVSFQASGYGNKAIGTAIAGDCSTLSTRCLTFRTTPSMPHVSMGFLIAGSIVATSNGQQATTWFLYMGDVVDKDVLTCAASVVPAIFPESTVEKVLDPKTIAILKGLENAAGIIQASEAFFTASSEYQTGQISFVQWADDVAGIVTAALDAIGGWILSDILTCVNSFVSLLSGALNFSVDSPVNLLVTAPNGQQVGFLSNGTEVNQIPGAIVTGPCSLVSDQLVNITIPRPTSGEYHVSVFPSCGSNSGVPYEVKINNKGMGESYSGTAFMGGGAKTFSAELGSNGTLNLMPQGGLDQAVELLEISIVAISLVVASTILLLVRNMKKTRSIESRLKD